LTDAVEKVGAESGGPSAGMIEPIWLCRATRSGLRPRRRRHGRH